MTPNADYNIQAKRPMQKTPQVLDFSGLSDDAIRSLLNQYRLNLTPAEALTIQQTLLKRPPTLAECILWSIQGSEHCSYKSSRPHLKQFVTSGPDVILGAKEDAGIVSIATDLAGNRYGLVVSHESHNHPSQIVPYEGAATGVGGNIRDVSCMGAKVIAIADSLRFGSLDIAKTHWIHQGVVAGIAGYGNPIGIPNLAGDLYYDPGYNENCLVTVVTLGIVREQDVIHSYAPVNADDYVFILVGKPTDNSGFGGASFASATLQGDETEKNKGAVQEPNAFLQRHILKANDALFGWLRDNHLIDTVGFKDLGAGGIACASVELAEAGGYGAEIDVEKVPTGMPNLMAPVILCSETQERFMWVVPRHLVDTILKHYNETYALPQVSEGACAAVIGKIRTDGQYIVRHEGAELINASAKAITQGIVYDRPYRAKPENHNEPVLAEIDYNQTLLSILAHENIASRAPILETYDKQVQGRTIVEAGWADAGVMQPFNDDQYPPEIQQTGVALSLDHNPRYNKISAYWGAVNAVVESVRNIAAVGAVPVAITDCLCFGNPENPEQMGEFVDAVKGIVAACAAITLQNHPDATLPVIAGNVSLYNDSVEGPIPPSPMISCVGVMPDVKQVLTYDLKRFDSLLILVGDRKDECGGSVFYQLLGELGANVPKPDLTEVNQQIHALYQAAPYCLAAHDIADGGLAAALAEMTFKREIGVKVSIPGELAIAKKLFSETGGFVLEVTRDKWKPLKQLFTELKLSVHLLGETTVNPQIIINDAINLPVADAKAAWENGLRGKL